jgi:hypothetical protein
MIRLRIAAVAAAASLAFVAVAAPIASAANGTGSKTQAYANLPALYTVPVKGTAKGGKTFTGTFGIERFVKANNKAYALGTLKGTVAGHHFTRYGVKLPASLNTNAASNSSARAAASCQILNLVLGPINLNLLGLVITTNQINLNITAMSGPGNLLGNLLCGVTNLLNPGGGGLLSSLQGDVNQLVGALNGLLGDLSLAGL